MDVIKDVLSLYGFLDCLQATVRVSVPVPANTITLSPTFLHDPAPYQSKRPRARPETKDVACQTPANIYLDADGFFQAVNPSSQRHRPYRASQTKWQAQRAVKHHCQMQIKEEFLAIVVERRQTEERDKFYSVPLDYSPSPSKGMFMVIIISICLLFAFS